MLDYTGLCVYKTKGLAQLVIPTVVGHLASPMSTSAHFESSWGHWSMLTGLQRMTSKHVMKNP